MPILNLTDAQLSLVVDALRQKAVSEVNTSEKADLLGIDYEVDYVSYNELLDLIKDATGEAKVVR